MTHRLLTDSVRAATSISASFPSALLLCLAALACPAMPALAQQAAGAPVSQLELQRPDAVNDLNGHLARLAEDPRDVAALIGAGEAALALDDGRAATGFFARADAIESGNGRIKAGLGRAMLKMRNPAEALRLFDQATRLGYPDRGFLSDRGLARDLTGDPAAAQRDYQAALKVTPDDSDLILRYALSLGISGQPDAADKVLQPLLYKSDRTAWRDRAFIMAMNGRRDQARDIAAKTMPPALAQAIQPYLDRMQALTPGQRAAAVHFGVFPTDPGVRTAAAVPAPPLPAGRPPAPAEATPAPQKPALADASAGRRGERLNSRIGRKIADVPDAAQETREVPAIPSARPAAPIRRAEAAIVQPVPGAPSVAPPRPSAPQVQGPPAPEPATPAAQSQLAAASPPPATVSAQPTPAPQPSSPPVTQTIDVRATRTLADIIRELRVPETERQVAPAALDLAALDAIQTEKRRQREATAAEKAKRDAAARAKAEAAARAKAEAEEKARLAKNPARSWVQVGTGRDVSALAFTMTGLRRKYASLASRDAWTAGWGRTNRLVIGPFSSFAKARDYEAQLKKAGADAFAWQSDAGEEVMRLPGK